MAASDNTQDEILTHAVDLERAKITNSAEVVSFLNDLSTSLVQEIAARPPPANASQATKDARLNALLNQTQASISSTYSDIADTHQDQLTAIAKLSGQVGANALNAGIGAQIAQSVALTKNQLSTLASDTLIQGAKSKDWWNQQDGDLQNSFAQQMRMGYARGESIDELAARVRGTEAASFKNGIMAESKRNADALVRTSIQTVSNEAKVATYNENADLLDGIEWIATLDTRTTPICRALDGKVWSLPDYKPVGHNFPYPGATAHWNCRSTQLPKLKSWSDLAGKKIITPEDGSDPTTLNNAFRDNLRAQGLSEDAIASAAYDARASMDGQSPATSDFGDWLKNKEAASPGFASDLLGPRRAELFNAGLVGVSDLVDSNYKTLTLDRLNQLVQDRAATIAGKQPSVPVVKVIPPPPLPPLADRAQAVRETLAQIKGDVATANDAVTAAANVVTQAYAAFSNVLGRTPEEKDLPGYEADREKALQAKEDALKAYKKAKDAYLKLSSTAIAEAQKHLTIDPSKAGQMSYTMNHDKSPTIEAGSKLETMASEGMALLQKLVEGSKFIGTTEPIFYHTPPGNDRAFYDLKNGVVLSATASTTRTALHELGHWLEDNSASILKASIDFLSKRTAGEATKSIADLTGNKSYANYEVAKPDKFLSIYMGKIYQTGNGNTYATEILSMGLEYFWYDPLNFAKNDPEYFDFVYSVLRS